MPYPLLLHSKHLETPVTYEPFGSWMVPWRFDTLETEYRCLRKGTGLLDYSTQALIEVQGDDRAMFLHNLLTNDIKRLTPGTGCQAALLTSTAKLVADLLVLADQDACWLLCDATRAAVVVETLNRYLFAEHVSLTNHERRDAVLALQGPRTTDCLGRLFGSAVVLPQSGDHVVRVFEGISLRLVRHSLAGEAGVLCLCPAEHAHRLWELLRARGAAAGLTLVGWEALNTARIEAGIPWFGIDMDETNLLPETGWETATVSDTKGCYLGQEIVARMRTYGSASKKLMGLLVEGARVPEMGDRIERDREPIGRITSACWSPSLERPVAMGYVKRGAYDPGARVEIVRDGQRLSAIVANRPLVPRGQSSCQ